MIVDEFVDLDSWTENTLQQFLALEASESQFIEYKGGDWITGRSRSQARSKIRKYVTAFANSGGGLLFIGVREDQSERHQPGVPDGIPTTYWNASDAQEFLRNSLNCKIFPALFPFPRIHCVALSDPQGSETIVIDVRETVQPFHQVSDGGGKIWLRFGDEIRECPPWLERTLLRERGLNRPILELVGPTSLSAEGRRVELTFSLSNYGSGASSGFQVGVVANRRQTEGVIQPGIPDYPTGSYTPDPILEGVSSLPLPLRPYFEIAEPIVSVLLCKDILKGGFLPYQQHEILTGLDGLMVEDAKLGLWIIADGCAQPIIEAYALTSAIAEDRTQRQWFAEKVKGPFPFGI